MMDGRFDSHFAEIFAASRVDEESKDTRFPLWPLIVVCIFGFAVLASALWKPDAVHEPAEISAGPASRPDIAAV